MALTIPNFPMYFGIAVSVITIMMLMRRVVPDGTRPSFKVYAKYTSIGVVVGLLVMGATTFAMVFAQRGFSFEEAKQGPWTKYQAEPGLRHQQEYRDIPLNQLK